MSQAMRIVEARMETTSHAVRTPFVYGKGVHGSGGVSEGMDVRVTVEDPASGRRAEGRGGMAYASNWSFPSKTIPVETRTHAMRLLAERYADALPGLRVRGHPLDLHFDSKPLLFDLRGAVAKELGLADPIPDLCALVCASPFDLAVHDAYGLLHHASSYDLLGPAHMQHDLGYYLGSDFKGRYPRDFLRGRRAATVRISHTVGIADALTDSDVPADAPRDGLPNSLEGWIRAQGLTAFKIKIRGDTDWDASRVLDVARVVDGAAAGDYMLTVDGNEQYGSADAVVETLRRIRDGSARAWRHLGYVEQPTPRALESAGCDFRAVTAFKPAIVDESVVSVETLLRAFELGWSGVGLKACKSLSACVLYTALARKQGKMVTVQDLTNTGLAHIASVGMAARVDPFGGVEHNSRQYEPEGNAPYLKEYGSVFSVKDGCVSTADLAPTGLGYPTKLKP